MGRTLSVRGLIFLLLLCGVSCRGNINERQANGKSESNQQVAQENQSKQKCIGNLHKPAKSSITNPMYLESNIYGVWTIDPNGPHADFEIDKDYYFLVDQEGDANMIYTICFDSIKVYFNDFTSKGQITKAKNDTLIIDWDSQGHTEYQRWKV